MRRVYFDTSVVVALFVKDAFSLRAERILAGDEAIILISDFAAAEFASAVSQRVRTRHLSISEAQAALADLDLWLSGGAELIDTESRDIAAAAAFIRRLDLPLRTPDALHIAIALRLGASLATFDIAMSSAAERLGLVVETV